MCTYIMFKLYVWDLLIQTCLLEGDSLDRAIGIVGIVPGIILGLVCICIDVIFLPLYLLIGILYVIFEKLEK